MRNEYIAAATALLVQHWLIFSTALEAAMLFPTNSYITPVSIMPYQEILLPGGLLMALCTFFQKRYVSAIDMAALGELHPVRSGVACPILALAAWRRGRPLWQSALLFGWAPPLWLALRRGLPESCTWFWTARSYSTGCIVCPR